jgi:hypothetical protein
LRFSKTKKNITPIHFCIAKKLEIIENKDEGRIALISEAKSTIIDYEIAGA